jgi:fermentation-respiration switch protein FrsA (DUF1100 family)
MLTIILFFPKNKRGTDSLELYIVKGAGHAKSFETDPQAYIEKISTFLKKYEK